MLRTYKFKITAEKGTDRIALVAESPKEAWGDLMKLLSKNDRAFLGTGLSHVVGIEVIEVLNPADSE